MTGTSRFPTILAATVLLAAAAVLLMVVGMNRGAPSGDVAHASDPEADRAPPQRRKPGMLLRQPGPAGVSWVSWWRYRRQASCQGRPLTFRRFRPTVALWTITTMTASRRGLYWMRCRVIALSVARWTYGSSMTRAGG